MLRFWTAVRPSAVRSGFQPPFTLLKALDHCPALFIIDLLSGDPDAWQAAETIRANKALGRIPMLFLAAAGFSDADAERAVALGGKGLLMHPVSPEALAAEIERILRRF